MVIRVGSRGSRLALTQATAAAERLRRPGVEIALVPITTAGDRDRTKPFGQIGERGVFVKELEEALLARPDRRGRPLREGHDLDGHRRARSRRLPGARGPTRRALRSAGAAARHAGRNGFGAPPRPAARARADALDRAAARQRRHAAAQAGRARPRRGRARRLRPRPARARRRDRPPLRARTSCFPRPARARSRCRCAPARRSSSPARTTRRRAVGSRPSAGASRRSAAAASRPSPPITTAPSLTALVADEDGRWVERRSRATIPRRWARSSRMRIVVTRPEARAPASWRERLEALGHEVAVRPLIETESLGDDPIELGRLRLGGSDEQDRAPSSSRGAPAPPWPRIAAIGPGTAEALRAAGHEPALVARGVDAGGAGGGVSASAGTGALRRGRGRSAAHRRGARRRLRAALPHGRAGAARAAARRPRRARVRLGGARLRAAGLADSGRLDRAGDDEDRSGRGR